MLFFILAGLAAAEPPQVVKNWVKKQAQSTPQIIQQTQALPYEVIRTFQKWSHDTIAAMLTNQLQNLPKDCSPWTKVQTPLAGSEKHSFTHHLLQLETFLCIPNEDVDVVQQKYVDPSFRTKAMQGVKKVWKEGEDNCILSHSFGGLISPVQYCTRPSIYKDKEFIVVHNHLVKSKTDEQFHPVYHLDELILFYPIGDDVGIYRITHNRIRELNKTTRMLLETTAKKAHLKIIQQMQKD